MISRRAFAAALAAGLVSSPPGARAQPAARIYRIGVLSSAGSPRTGLTTVSSLLPRALEELGYVEGRTLVVETRLAEGKLDRLPDLQMPWGW